MGDFEFLYFMQNIHEGDWKHRHSTESSLPGGGLVDAENSALLSFPVGLPDYWTFANGITIRYSKVINALQMLVTAGNPIILSNPYVGFRGDLLIIFTDDDIAAGLYQGDVSNLRTFSDFAGYLDFTRAEGPGARPVHDRPSNSKPDVDGDASSLKCVSLEMRDWSRPGVVYREASDPDDSDSDLASGVLVALRVYIGLVAIALICSIIYYVMTYA